MYFGYRHMAFGAERYPCTRRPLSSSKLYQSMNANIFRVLVLEPLILLLCLAVVETLNLKLRLKIGLLRLQNLYLRFRIRKTVERERKAFAHYVRDREVFQGVLGNGEYAHNGDGVVTPNY